MQQGICNPEFYGDLVYKFKKIIGNPNFSNLLKRIVNRIKRAGYSLDIMRRTACLVFFFFFFFFFCLVKFIIPLPITIFPRDLGILWVFHAIVTF